MGYDISSIPLSYLAILKIIILHELKFWTAQ